ncbi:hypothetical protein NDU88_001509 [Pleurodeles waltl]|uniref:Uncharacterized protein n=1 Tax=Pleurodeles waltl TaxID=8319 RepID=A0AAV7MLY1_PLEWA|nr:hypothetical protein NDU88_001509 [Pleurodeles waltl]
MLHGAEDSILLIFLGVHIRTQIASGAGLGVLGLVCGSAAAGATMVQKNARVGRDRMEAMAHEAQAASGAALRIGQPKQERASEAPRGRRIEACLVKNDKSATYNASGKYATDKDAVLGDSVLETQC